MSTKVKGEAIKEGSIPLSALSNEVKDKIENAVGGADWNAQEGEAGYIENKPFRKIKSKYNEISNINSYFIITEGAFYPTNDLFIKYNNKTVLLAKEKQEIYWGDGTTVQIHDAAFFLADDGESNIIVAGECEFDFELIIALSSEFISISDAFLNQALANLGIDPVVWKYMCNPIIIKQGEKVPEELIGEYSSDVGEYGGYYLKYHNLGMYKIMITSNTIDTDFDGDCSVILTPSSMSEAYLNTDYVYISKDYGVYTGSVYIDENKNWCIQ